MKQFFYRLFERFVIWRYRIAGELYGDLTSYDFMKLENPSRNRLRKRWWRWERRYVAWLSYRPIPLDQFQLAGGYGENVDHLYQVPFVHHCNDYELWLFRNKKAYFSVKEGLESAINSKSTT